MNSTLNTGSDTLKGMNGNLTGGNDAFAKALSSQSAEDFASARSSIDGPLGDMRSKFAEASANASRQARIAAQATQQYVRENPWKTVGLAVVTGLVIGAFIKRR